MVLEFDRPFTPTPSVSIDGNALQVTLTGVSNNQIDTQIGEDNTDIIRLDVSQKSDTIQVETVTDLVIATHTDTRLSGVRGFLAWARQRFTSASAQVSTNSTRSPSPSKATPRSAWCSSSGP